MNVHGSMGAAVCKHCGHEVDLDKFCEGVQSKVKDISSQDTGAPAESSPIVCKAYGNPFVKPTIVLVNVKEEDKSSKGQISWSTCYNKLSSKGQLKGNKRQNPVSG